MTPKQWINTCTVPVVCMFLIYHNATGNPHNVHRDHEHAARKDAQEAPSEQAHMSRFQNLADFFKNLENEDWKTVENSVSKLKGTEWPEPLKSLRRDMLRAALFGAVKNDQKDLIRSITTESTFIPDLPAGASTGGVARSEVLEALLQSAKRLSLAEKLTPSDTRDMATQVAPETAQESDRVSQSEKTKRVVSEKERLAELQKAWKSGRTQDAYRLAKHFSFNPHRRSCQAAWIYAQYVLGRVSRSGQDRKSFFKHQQEVGKRLFAPSCQARHFSMAEKTFTAFRLDELNWAARLFWENADLNEARRYGERALLDALASDQTRAALEALQVLYGRIGFEEPNTDQSLKEMEDWRNRIARQAAPSSRGGPDWRSVLSWLEHRMALFEFQARRYDQCTKRLNTELQAELSGGPVNTWEKRRLIAQLAYWKSRCAALGNDPRALEIIAQAEKLVHHFAPTGYYAMLLDEVSDTESAAENVTSKAIKSLDLKLKATQWPQPPLRDPHLFAKIDELIRTIKSEPQMVTIPLIHPLNQYVTRWVLDITRDQEHLIYAHSVQTFSELYTFMNQLKRYRDSILSAGRLSRFLDLTAPGAEPVLKALFPPAWLAEFKQAGKLCSINWKLLYAVARQESLFDPYAVSPAGARGILQIMPFVWDAFFKKLPPHLSAQRLQNNEPFDPRSNIIAGACHLKESLKHYGGNLVHALAGYNAGKAAVDQWIARRPTQNMELYIEFIPYAETQDYVKRILRTIHQLKRFPI